MKNKKDKGCLNLSDTRLVKIILICIITLLIVSCFGEWYPIYEDWLCTININGTDLNYLRNSFGNFLLSPDRETLIEYTKNKFYSVSLNDLSLRTLLFDFGNDPSAIDQPALSNNSIVYNYHGDIYIYDISNADTSKIASSTGSTPFKSLTISDDGTQVAYTTINDSLSSIILVNIDRSDKFIFETENTDSLKTYIENVRLINNFYKNKFIIFSLHGDSKTFFDGIYYIDSSGGGCPSLIAKDVNPDHLTISDEKDYLLYVFDGHIKKTAVEGTGNIVLDETYNGFFFPSFTPDGQRILYAKEDYPYIISSDGTNKYKLIDKMIGYTNPDYKESYFIDDNKILITLKKQIN